MCYIPTPTDQVTGLLCLCLLHLKFCIGPLLHFKNGPFIRPHPAFEDHPIPGSLSYQSSHPIPIKTHDTSYSISIDSSIPTLLNHTKTACDLTSQMYASDVFVLAHTWMVWKILIFSTQSYAGFYPSYLSSLTPWPINPKFR
jgi:hypothetical protein